MTSALLTFLDGNVIVPLLATAAYVVYREVGAVVAAAFGQYFVSASSLFRTYAMSGMDQSCTTNVVFLALLPLLIFATVPVAHSEMLRRQNPSNNAFDLLLFFAMLFAAISANHCVLALNDVPMARDAAWGEFSIAVLLAAGAINLGKLSSERLATAARPNVPSSAHSATTPDEALAVTSPRFASVKAGACFTLVDNEAQSDPAQFSQWPRPEPVSTTYLFNRNEFFIYRHEHLKDLENLLRREPPGVLEGLHVAICRRLGRLPIPGDDRAFVRAYVDQFRKRIEKCYPAYFTSDHLELRAA